MIDINDLTLGQIKQLQSIAGQPTEPMHPYSIGKNIFIRTVTHHLTGRLVAVHAQELVLEDASWIADDGRFAEAMESGKFGEVEPYPSGCQVFVGRAGIIDARHFAFTLPRSQK
jgi:hypothetical protein